MEGWWKFQKSVVKTSYYKRETPTEHKEMGYSWAAAARGKWWEPSCQEAKKKKEMQTGLVSTWALNATSFHPMLFLVNAQHVTSSDIKTRTGTVIKKMCQIYISNRMTLYTGFFLSLGHVRLPSMCFYMSVKLLTQLLQRGSRMLGRVCQAHEADSPKSWFRALYNLISSSQVFCLERPDLTCSLAVNAIMKTVEVFVEGYQVYWILAVALVQKSTRASAGLSLCAWSQYTM